LSDEAGPVVVFVDEAALQVLAPAVTGGLRIVGTDFDDIICGSAYVDNVILGGAVTMWSPMSGCRDLPGLL